MPRLLLVQPTQTSEMLGHRVRRHIALRERHPELAECKWKQCKVSHEEYLRSLDSLQKTRITRILNISQLPPDIPEIQIT